MICWRTDTQTRPEQDIQEMLYHAVGNDRHNHETQHEDKANQRLVKLTGFHQLMGRMGQSVLETHRPKEGRNQNQTQGRANGRTPWSRHIFHNERTGEKSNQNHCDDDGGIDDNILELSCHETGHVDLLSALHLDSFFLVDESVLPTLRDALHNAIVARNGRLDGIRRKESRDNGHRDDSQFAGVCGSLFADRHHLRAFHY